MTKDAVLWDKSWEPFFSEESEKLERIFSFLNAESGRAENGAILPAYFPDKNNIFRFTAIRPDRIKGVIVGMEPYASYTVKNGTAIPEATGRSFEVASVDSWHQKFKQSSLRNFLKAIFCEVENDSEASLEVIRNELQGGYVDIPSPHEWFNIMEGRGIMFLNAALTVKPGVTGSHMALWQDFSRDLAGYMAVKSPDACWMLFGKDAQNLYEPILMEHGRSNIVKTCHPRLPGFVKERPVRKIRRII